jgi:hypothetical protein
LIYAVIVEVVVARPQDFHYLGIRDDVVADGAVVHFHLRSVAGQLGGGVLVTRRGARKAGEAVALNHRFLQASLAPWEEARLPVVEARFGDRLVRKVQGLVWLDRIS